MSEAQKEEIGVARGLLESESARLQREVERFTGKLETERRLGLVLDEDIKSAKKILQQKQLAVKETYQLQKVNNRDLEKISELETTLNSMRVHLGDLASSNVRLREKVDGLRKGNLDSRSYFRTTTQAIQGIHSSVERVHNEVSRTRRAESMLQTRMLHLQDSFETDRLSATGQIDSLAREIKEDRKRKNELMKKLNLSIAMTNTELSESGQVTKHLYEKWMRRLRDKRKEFDQYVAFVADISAGMTQMKEMSGLDDLEQVVRSLLNSMERQREIQNHLIHLTEQIETIKVELKAAKTYIESVNSKEEAATSALRNRENQHQSKLSSLERGTEEMSQTLKMIKEAVVGLRDPVSMMRGLCQELGIKTEIAQGVLVDDEDFTLATAGVHLLELEEMLSKLASIIKASRIVQIDRSQSNSFFLTEKRFDKAINISALLNDESLLVGEEEGHPLNASEFRMRAEKAVGALSL